MKITPKHENLENEMRLRFYEKNRTNKLTRKVTKELRITKLLSWEERGKL